MWTWVFISLGQMPVSIGLLGHFARTWEETAKLPEWLYHFAVPPAMHESSGCSASLSALDIASTFYLAIVVNKQRPRYGFYRDLGTIQAHCLLCRTIGTLRLQTMSLVIALPCHSVKGACLVSWTSFVSPRRRGSIEKGQKKGQLQRTEQSVSSLFFLFISLAFFLPFPHLLSPLGNKWVF